MTNILKQFIDNVFNDDCFNEFSKCSTFAFRDVVCGETTKSVPICQDCEADVQECFDAPEFSNKYQGGIFFDSIKQTILTTGCENDKHTFTGKLVVWANTDCFGSLFSLVVPKLKNRKIAVTGGVFAPINQISIIANDGILKRYPFHCVNLQVICIEIQLTYYGCIDTLIDCEIIFNNQLC